LKRGLFDGQTETIAVGLFAMSAARSIETGQLVRMMDPLSDSKKIESG